MQLYYKSFNILIIYKEKLESTVKESQLNESWLG